MRVGRCGERVRSARAQQPVECLRAAAHDAGVLLGQEFGLELGMPVVRSNITQRRDPYFRQIYSELLSSLRSNGILRGAWLPEPYPNPTSSLAYTGGPAMSC